MHRTKIEPLNKTVKRRAVTIEVAQRSFLLLLRIDGTSSTFSNFFAWTLKTIPHHKTPNRWVLLAIYIAVGSFHVANGIKIEIGLKANSDRRTHPGTKKDANIDFWAPSLSDQVG